MCAEQLRRAHAHRRCGAALRVWSAAGAEVARRRAGWAWVGLGIGWAWWRSALRAHAREGAYRRLRGWRRGATARAALRRALHCWQAAIARRAGAAAAAAAAVRAEVLASPRRLNFEDDATITAPGEVHWRQRALPSAFGKLRRAAAMAPRHSAAALRRHGLRLRAALASWRGHTRQARLTITAMVVARARARSAAACALRSWAGAP